MPGTNLKFTVIQKFKILLFKTIAIEYATNFTNLLIIYVVFD